jgi:hypothetical protein
MAGLSSKPHLTSKPLDQVRKDLPKTVEDKVRLNLVVPASRRKRWKAEALARDQDLSELVVEAVEAYLAKK